MTDSHTDDGIIGGDNAREETNAVRAWDWARHAPPTPPSTTHTNPTGGFRLRGCADR